jgi:predicted dehydrogenase
VGTRRIGVIVDGASGRLGTRQHLIRSLLAIAGEGGLTLADGSRLVPEPMLLGRDEGRVRARAEELGGLRWSTDRAACLSDPANAVYFDASVTGGRFARAMQAVAAGRHVYLEKPIAETLSEATALHAAAEAAGIRHGLVCDKLHLTGVRQLTALRDSGFFGRVHSMRLEYGFWVFDGTDRPCQRSSWNYRRASGGGIVLDMFTHWYYLTARLAGPPSSVSCVLSTRTGRRIDEAGVSYDVDVEDEVFAHVRTRDGAMVSLFSSWAMRAGGPDMFGIQIDGSDGSAIAGVHDCRIQAAAETPTPVWDADDPEAHCAGLAETWRPAPDAGPPVNGYRAGWEAFLRHVAGEDGFPCTLAEGVHALRFIDACYESARTRQWIDIPDGGEAA